MPSGDGRRFTGGEARGTRQEENERTHARTHAARTERGGAEVNASRSPKFLGQPVVRATRSTELVDPRRWVVVAPVTSIPAEALQSKRPMPKTHTTRELSLSPTSSSRYPNARQFQRDSHSFSIFSVRPSHRRRILETKIFPFQKFAKEILQKLETPVRDGKRKNQLGGGN